MLTLFEIFMQFSGYNLIAAVKRLNKIQKLSPAEFKIWQDQEKWSIAKHHYENNTFYKAKVGPSFPYNWEDLPIMEKSDYQDDFEKLLSNGYSKKNTYIANTSGSSGHPFFFAKNKEAHAMTWALVKDRYNWHDLSLISKQARFYGIPLETTSRFQEKIKDFILNRVRFPIFDMSDKVLSNFIKKFKKIKFNYIYGYTNSLVLFARYLLRNNIILKEVCPTLKLCIPTSETVTKEDRKILADGFGVKIVNEYGVSEAGGIVAFEDRDSNWIISAETQYVEVVDDNDQPVPNNKSGNIIITDLHNKAMPFIRYKVGDIGVISNYKVDNKYPVLKKLLGRTNDNIILPSRKVSPGLTFYYISRSILESSGVLKEFIIRQTELDTFLFDVVTDRDLYDNEIKSIKKKLALYLEPGLKFKINRVPFIKRPPSGKIKHFYSELNE